MSTKAKNFVKLALLALLGLGGWGLAQVFGKFSYPADLTPSHADVPYANTSPSQTLDVFTPQGAGPFPVVLNIHGGAFKMGSKEMLDAPVARGLLKAGVAVVSVNYRLSGEARFPAAVQDVKAAVRFLRANASTYRINPNGIVAFGQSAGGNLASMLGASAQVAEFDDPKLGNPAVSSQVQGVIDWFGPSDFLQMDAQAQAQGCGARDATHGLADSPESLYLGATIATVPHLAAKSNPITYLSAAAPPYLLQKGSLDCTVPVGQSTLLFQALQAKKVPSELVMLDGAGHGDRGQTGQFTNEANVARVVAFVLRAVAGQARL